MDEKLTSIISEINEATNALAAKLDAELAQIAALKAQGLPPSDATIASLQAAADRLKAFASDPSNPVPPATT